ncbi:MAG TPA: PAS domain S-box protein [Thermoanaerobaculia bacterium]|nr:PAS domain S-box protein [Thermoanaerobaculia bacterium]
MKRFAVLPKHTPDVANSAEELASLVDGVQDYAIFLLGPDGEIRSWNSGAHRIMGYAPDEIIGRNFSIFYGPEDLATDKPGRELRGAALEGRYEDEGWRVRKDGGRFWASTIITALKNAEGVVRGFAKVTRDLTERREADERLRQSEEMFRLLVSSVRDYAIFMLDPNGNISTWNAGARRIKGYEANEIIGRHFSSFYPEEDKRNHKPERELAIAREKGAVEDEGWRLRKDGSRFWANVVITAVHDASGNLRGFAKVTRDITERKRAEDAELAVREQREARLQAEVDRRKAEASSRAAQEANRSKDEFLMTLSHELRTPMTAILGWARLLPSIAVSDPSFREAVASIGRAAQLQANLIDDVLDVSRIMSGKLRLNRDTIEIARVVKSAIDSVRSSAEAKKIRIQTNIDPDLGTMFVDPTRLQQVVWNLLTNAVKFTPADGIIHVTARRTPSEMIISVADNGEGIDAQFLPHVFEAFRQAENATTRVHGGLGLGLSIVRYIAEAHGGTIAAASQGRGRGATFTFTLPLAQAATRTAPDVPKKHDQIHAPAPAGRLANRTILVVEDDQDSREMIAAVLRMAGAKVTAVESAPAGLEFLDNDAVETVVTDIGMPDMDGYTFAREVRERYGEERPLLIALTAFPALTAGTNRRDFDTFLSKPIEPAVLVDCVAKALDSANKA